MKRVIFILTIFAFVVTSCNRANLNETKTNEATHDSETPQTLYIDAEENFQHNTSWNCIDTNTVIFQKFRPDTMIMPFDYIPFDVFESYQMNDLKLLFGHYKASDKGEFSPYDSETDYGHRLLCFNSKNQLVFRSSGAMDTYCFVPHFYRSEDKAQTVILCQEGTEYYWGSDAFLIEKNNIYHIGFLDVEVYANTNNDEYDSPPISSVTNIKRIGNMLEFTFDADSLVFNPGGLEESLVTDVKYIYKTGILRMEKKAVIPQTIEE